MSVSSLPVLGSFNVYLVIGLNVFLFHMAFSVPDYKVMILKVYL